MRLLDTRQHQNGKIDLFIKNIIKFTVFFPRKDLIKIHDNYPKSESIYPERSPEPGSTALINRQIPTYRWQ